MTKLNRMTICCWGSAIALFIMAATILVMPFASETRAFVVIVGVVFWLFAFIGYGLLIVADSARKKAMRSMVELQPISKERPGIITFFSNVYAAAADTTMILSFVLFIAINFTEFRTSYFAYILLFLLVYSIHMHCLLNGKNCKAIQLSKNIKHMKERYKRHE